MALSLMPVHYIIFITEKDFYGMGEPLYVIERMNLTTGKGFGDGEYILYVNGEYRGESDLGKLMHDFNCTEADDMKFDLMAERTRYLKENPKGVQEMCKVMEDMRNEAANLAAQKKAMDIASAMIMAGKYALEEISALCGLSLDEVRLLQVNKKV